MTSLGEYSVSEQVSRALAREGPGFDPLLLTLTLSLIRAGADFERAHVRELAPHGLTTGQFNVLTVLDRAEGAMTMGEVGQAVSVRPANLTGVVDVLARRGLVAREPHPTDRRASNVRLTQQGRDFLGPFLQEHWRYLGRLFAGLTLREREDLGRLLEAFHESVRAAGADG